MGGRGPAGGVAPAGGPVGSNPPEGAVSGGATSVVGTPWLSAASMPGVDMGSTAPGTVVVAPTVMPVRDSPGGARSPSGSGE
jgi:hypothetical protein